MSSSRSTARSLKISSTFLVVVALGLWLCSLPLTGFVLYAEQKQMMGLEILMLGWLSPLLPNFAWFANPLFLLAVISLFAGRPAPILTIVSAILALDTFRLSSYPLNEGGASTPIYGFGWGVIFWFTALLLIMAASGSRQVELRIETNGKASKLELLRPIGFFLCIAILGTTAYFGIHDRLLANSIERERLSGLVFKRDAVCSAVEPTALGSLIDITRPIEVRLASGKNASSSYPFNRPTNLLEWGIPIIRVAGRDYSYADTGKGRVLASVPATAIPSGTLAVTDSIINKHRQISVTLDEQPSGRRVFSQTWTEETSGARFCPDYSNFPTNDQQPKKAIIEALGIRLQPAAARSAPGSREPSDNRVNAIKIDQPGSDGWIEFSGQRPLSYLGPNPALGPNAWPWWPGNRNCPEYVGWDGRRSESPVRLDTGWPFMVGDKAFYLPGVQQYNALCEGDHVYLYSSFAQREKSYITIEKRMLLDFRQEWIGSVVIQDKHLPSRDNVLKVQSVEEDGEGVSLKLLNEETWQIATFKAPLKIKQ